MREKGTKSGPWEGNGRLYSEEKQVPKRRRRASKENFPRKSGRKDDQVSGRKSFLGRSG